MLGYGMPGRRPVRSIRWCGSNTIMPGSHTRLGGLRAEAGAEPEAQPLPCGANKGPDSTDTTFRIMYIMFTLLQQGCPSTPLTAPRLLLLHRARLMRDRNLTGAWAGFSFKGGRLVAPEGRQLLPEDLACVRAGSASATHDSAATRPWRCAAAPSRCSIAALRFHPCRQRPTALPPRCRKPACAQSRSTVLVCLGDAPHLGSTPAQCPCSSGARADRCAAGI